MDLVVRSAEVHQCGYQRDAADVYDVSIVVEDVDVGADVPALGACDDAQALRVEGTRSSDRLLQDTREQDLSLVLSAISVSPSTTYLDTVYCLHLPAYFECWTGDGTEFGGDDEDAVELPVWVGGHNLGGDVDHYSRLAHPHICDAVFLAKRQLHVAELVESTSIQSHILAQRREQELALVVGWICFAWHCG